jgi:hypothetical protein
MSRRRLILLMSVSMDGFAGRPGVTIDWLTPSTGRDHGRDHGDQRHRLTLETAPVTGGESRWES